MISGFWCYVVLKLLLVLFGGEFGVSTLVASCKLKLFYLVL